MSQLLADDRFFLRAGSLEEGIASRCDDIVALPDCFWHRLVEVGGLQGSFSPWEVRHKTVLCMYKGLSYVQCNGFAQLREYPLSLTQGDIAANLNKLDAYGGDLDELTADILLCYRLDPGPRRSIEALALLQHASGSTGLCE